jgi:hypothetical protein
VTTAATSGVIAREGAAATDWSAANHRRLRAALDIAGHRLRFLIAMEANGEAGADSVSAELERAIENEQVILDGMPRTAALEAIAAAFRLSSFEQHLLLLCAGVELDAEIAALCASLHRAGMPIPTYELAARTHPNAHWSALVPTAPLRHWMLVDVGAGDTLTGSPLRIDERILFQMLGVPYLDSRIGQLLRPAPRALPLTRSLEPIATRLVEAWNGAVEAAPVQLVSEERACGTAIVSAAAAAFDAPLFVLGGSGIPTTAADRDVFARLWQREAALANAVLLIDATDGATVDLRAAADLLHRLSGAAVLLVDHAPVELGVETLRLDAPAPDAAERVAVWNHALGRNAGELNGVVERAVAQFKLDAGAVVAAAARYVEGSGVETSRGRSRAECFWEVCREAARPGMGGLAERIVSKVAWSDLVLPAPQLGILRQIGAAVAHRATVHERWGFAARGQRGLGIAALFAGASGTGKTLAAEIIANELRLDLYRVDLSRVVSKYIGETEKNLATVFDAAEAGGAVLLFDEADALFGRRSEVKDSHDRFANIEISYLLQRMEAYRGLAILTTNMRNALDPAFLRRIRFVVQFPFPDAVQRAEIWRRVLPPDLPSQGLEPSKLSKLNLAGGSIRNVAINAAFLAAAEQEPLTMQHVLIAARNEYAKLEKPLTDAEVAGWR